MRIVLVGAVESTRAALHALISAKHAPVALVTLPLANNKRHSDFVDLHAEAQAAGIPVIDAADVNSAGVLAQIRGLAPDVIFVIGWSQICRRELLELARCGCIGYHPALLPLNRGRAVIAWTILQGLDHAGGSLFWLADGVDAGDLILQRRFPVAPDETARSLMDKHLVLIPQMLLEAVAMLVKGNLRGQPQDEREATYCARRTAEDGWIEWERPAREIWTLIRAVGDPYPGAFTSHRGRKLTIWSAELALGRPFWGMPGQIQQVGESGVLVQCGDREHLQLKRVQFENGAPQDAVAADLKIHEKFGQATPSIINAARGLRA